MAIRIPRRQMPQEPQQQLAGGSSVEPVRAITNPAAVVARPAQQAAGLAAEIYQEARDREVQTKVLELDIERRKADGDVLNGYTQSLGKDAVARRGEVLAALRENSKRVKAGIKDRAVADVWARQDAALTAAAIDQADAHYQRQNIKWQADTHEARADLLASDLGRVAFGDGWDPATGRLSAEAERTRSGYLDSVAELGAVLGWSREQIEVAQRRADTQGLGQVAESLIRQDRFDEAQKVLEAHGERIDVGVRDRLMQLARDGQAQQRAQQATAQRAEKAQRWTFWVADQAAARGGTIAEQKAWALSTAEYTFRGQKLTAEEYESVVPKIERHFRMRDERESAAEKQMVVAAERFLVENPLATIEDQPQLYEELKRTGQLDGVLRFQSSGRYSTDPDVYAQVRAASDEELRQISADRLWMQLRPKLSDQDLKEAMARHASANNSADDDQLYLLEKSQRVQAAARAMGILPADPRVKRDEGQQAAFDAWQLQLERDLRVWQKANGGKKPTMADLQEMLDLRKRDYVERFVDEPWYAWSNDHFETVPLSTIDREQASVVFGGERIDLKRVPEREWSDIAARLARRGHEASVANIVEVWVQQGRPGDLAPPGRR